jgi:lipopolysaccharide export system protein LptC
MRDQSTLVTSLILLGGLAAGSYWLAERARLGDATASAPKHEPDYIVEQFNMTRMNLNGIAQYSMQAQQMTHYADDDSTTMVKPVMVNRKPGRPEVFVNADRGMATSGAEQVELHDNAVLKRAATATSAEMNAYSDYFLVLPDEDRVRTDQAVKMTQAGSTVHAQSMEYDNGYLTMLLNSLTSGRGHAEIAPRNRPASSTGTRPTAAPASP